MTLGVIFQNINKVTEINKFLVLQLFKIMMMLLKSIGIQSIKTTSQGPTVKVRVNMITKPPLL